MLYIIVIFVIICIFGAIIEWIKDLICDHIKDILIFLGIVGGIIVFVFCAKKFGLWTVIKIILLGIGIAIVGTFLWAFISVGIEDYYNRKAVKTEAKIRNFVFKQSKFIEYNNLKSTVINRFGRIKLGKKHDVMDYINQAIDDFTERNRRDAISIIVTDIKQKISVNYNDYYDNIKSRIGSYCIGNISFKSLVDNTLNEYAIKLEFLNSIFYIEKNASFSEKNFKCGAYQLEINNDDDDDDDEFYDDYEEDDDYEEYYEGTKQEGIYASFHNIIRNAAKSENNIPKPISIDEVPIDILMAANKSDYIRCVIDEEDYDD